MNISASIIDQRLGAIVHNIRQQASEELHTAISTPVRYGCLSHLSFNH